MNEQFLNFESETPPPVLGPLDKRRAVFSPPREGTSVVVTCGGELCPAEWFSPKSHELQRLCGSRAKKPE